jgi:hypothetical protein
MANSKAKQPMFNALPGTDSAGIFNSNSHPVGDYILEPERLIDPYTPLAYQVCQQVFGGSGARMSFSATTMDPRNPAGWPRTDTIFPSLEKKGKR